MFVQMNSLGCQMSWNYGDIVTQKNIGIYCKNQKYLRIFSYVS